MDIDKVNFPARLLEILTAVSESHFVSIDLELSGIPVRQGGFAGKQTLQQRYKEVKEAAEQYQILQIGVTCVHEDVATGTYECRPYNVNLSPTIEERLDIDRTFSFHSGAVDFLLGVGFEFNVPFQWGVPYLSRDETRLAKKKADARHDGAAYSDMVIKPEETETLEFMRRVRGEITEWKKNSGGPSPALLFIGPSKGRKDQQGPESDELSRFEKRLVHQLVRAEFPDLVSIPKRGLIQIVPLDQEREDYIKAQRKKEARERIYRQVGFRWIIEAIAGNDLSNIDLKSLAKDPNTGEAIFVDLQDYRARFNRAQSLVRDRPRVVVGHNFFLDIVYIYRTFIGQLPETVEEFQRLLHALFPLIIDTKYVATHNCGDINPMSSLQQIAEYLEVQEKPTIRTHDRHGKYNDVTAFHEAGYDSLLTAEVAIRLSAKLEAQGSSIDEAAAVTTPEEGGGVKINGVGADKATSSDELTSTSSVVNGVKSLLLAPFKVLDPKGQSSDEDEDAPTTVTTQKTKKKKGKKCTQAAVAGGRFAHSTAFSSLQDAPSENDVLQFDDLPTSDMVTANTDGATPASEVQDGPGIQGSRRPTKEERQSMKLMPRFDSDFWKVYGNKLRVFGSQEGVFVLQNLEATAPTDDHSDRISEVRW